MAVRNAMARWRVYGPTEFDLHIINDHCLVCLPLGRFCQKGRKIFEQSYNKGRDDASAQER